MPTSTSSLRLAALSLLVALSGSARALDNAPSANTPDKLAAARAHLGAKQWTAAVDELKKINDVNSADWNNLMGYSLRKADPANYASAERFYNDALQIEPKHRGALEYSGELYLMTDNLPMAEQRLAALDKACRLPCAEYTDLKRAVARYKAAGNKYVAQ
ncbi:MAG: hypothetical protein ABIO71_07325 [Caldimonas sp.]